MTIAELEKKAGITDRAAFWKQFAHIKGTIRINGIERDKSLETGIAALRRLAAIKGETTPSEPGIASFWIKEAQFRAGLRAQGINRVVGVEARMAERRRLAATKTETGA